MVSAFLRENPNRPAEAGAAAMEVEPDMEDANEGGEEENPPEVDGPIDVE